jgi:hypothetical protein
MDNGFRKKGRRGMRSWKSLVMVAGAMGFVVAALGSEAAADSQTKPKTEQATDAEKKMTQPKPDTNPAEEAGKGTATQEQSGAAGHEGRHEGHEGSHSDEEKDEGSH